MEIEEARKLVGKYCSVLIKHSPRDAERLGRETEGSEGIIMEVSTDRNGTWLVYEDGWANRIDGIIECEIISGKCQLCKAEGTWTGFDQSSNKRVFFCDACAEPIVSNEFHLLNSLIPRPPKPIAWLAS